jgi:hypothetical protein
MIRELVGHGVGLGLISALIGCGGVEQSLGDAAGGEPGSAARSSGSSHDLPAGGRAGESATGGQAGDGADAAAAGKPGVGPIDATDLPQELALVCDGPYPSLAIALPCRVGLNLQGPGGAGAGVHATECRLTRASDQTAIAFLLPLANLPTLLNQPVDIPFEASAVPVPGADLGGERFGGALSGVATFSQVSLNDRAFVAELRQAHVSWSGDHGTTFSCEVAEGPFWAVAGDFL